MLFLKAFLKAFHLRKAFQWLFHGLVSAAKATLRDTMQRFRTRRLEEEHPTRSAPESRSSDLTKIPLKQIINDLMITYMSILCLLNSIDLISLRSIDAFSLLYEFFLRLPEDVGGRGEEL